MSSREARSQTATQFSRPQYVGGKVLFSLPQITASVRMSIYTLAGRFVRDVMNKTLSSGNYSVSIDTRGISSQVLSASGDHQPGGNGNEDSTCFSQHGRGDRSEFFRIPDAPRKARRRSGHASRNHAGLHQSESRRLTALSGQNDFMLTKNSSWNGDTAGFWGSGYPVATGGVTYVILNRTNGVWPDSQIYWALSQKWSKNKA